MNKNLPPLKLVSLVLYFPLQLLELKTDRCAMVKKVSLTGMIVFRLIVFSFKTCVSKWITLKEMAAEDINRWLQQISTDGSMRNQQMAAGNINRWRQEISTDCCRRNQQMATGNINRLQQMISLDESRTCLQMAAGDIN